MFEVYSTEEMVPREGESLNSLSEVFEVLQDWEHQLKHQNIDFEGPEP